MQALPSGVETDFILVSCAGVATPGVDELQQESVTAAKRQGEASLRTSGLSYTVVRPGPIIDEPGGYKALVFDQVDLEVTGCIALGWVYKVTQAARQRPSALFLSAKALDVKIKRDE